MASGPVVLCTTAFKVTYNRIAPWCRSGLGRVVMAIAGSVDGFAVYTVLITLFPTGPAAVALRIARIVLQVGIAGLMVQQTRILRRMQKRDKSGSHTWSPRCLQPQAAGASCHFVMAGNRLLTDRYRNENLRATACTHSRGRRSWH